MTKPPSTSAQASPAKGLFFSQPYLLLALAPAMWGGNAVASKIAAGEIDPYLLTLGRWAGAVLLLLVVALPHTKRDLPMIRKGIIMLALYGVLGFASFNILMYLAAHTTTGVSMSIEQAVIPMMVLIANFVIFGVRAKFLQIVGLILTVIGVAWVATHGQPQRILALDINIGDGLMLIACLLYAAYSVALRYKPSIHWLSFIFVTASFALVTSLVFQATLGGGLNILPQTIVETTLTGWACVIYIMIFPSIIAQLFYARGVELIGANRASIFINLLPIYGTVLSVIILGEAFEPYHIVATVLVVVGIALAEWASRGTFPAPRALPTKKDIK